MIISGIRANESFYNYNSIKSGNVSDASSVTPVAKESKQDASQDNNQTQLATTTSQQPNQNMTAYDFAQQYDKDATYEMKGADSDLASLDVENAITQMQKDQMLQQYQFFVGNQGAIAEESEKTTRPVEDFIL